MFCDNIDHETVEVGVVRRAEKLLERCCTEAKSRCHEKAAKPQDWANDPLALLNFTRLTLNSILPKQLR